VRAGSAYVVAPWCRTDASVDVKATTGVYVLEADAELAPAPIELVEHCKRPDRIESPPAASYDDLSADGYPIDPGLRMQVEVRIGQLIEELRRSVIGERNFNLNTAAFQIGALVCGGYLGRGTAEALLRAEGEALGLTHEEVRMTVRSGLHGAKKRPVEVLRPSIFALHWAKYTLAPIEPRPVAYAPPRNNIPQPPIVERLLYPGEITVLSGASGTGKTTIGASLLAACAAGVRHFSAPGFDTNLHSDVLAREACWIFVSYEGSQYLDLHRAAWHEGTGMPEIYGDRRALLTRRGPLVWTTERRVTAMDMAQVDDLDRALAAMAAAHPGLPLVVVLDNATSAIENSMDPQQCAVFMRAMRGLADRGVAVMLFAHPPKAGTSVVYGSHVLYSLADIVGELEVIKKTKEEWTQWVTFDKHRAAPNGRCLALRSRRLPKPLIELPPDWDDDNPRARQRALEDLRTPYIFEISVRQAHERDLLAHGVTEKTAVEIPINVAQNNSGAMILPFIDPKAPKP
jgi:hypothetical protein